MNIKDVTIIIPTRNNIEFLTLALDSIREQYKEVPILIAADECNQDMRRFLRKNREKYNYVDSKHTEREGITITVDKLVEKVETPVVFYMHDDMVVGKNILENLLKNLKEQTIVSATRIEPPLHGPEKCKIIENCGIYAEDFDKTKFDAIVNEFLETFKDKTSNGIFAPFMFYKKDWINHDKLFIPQSHEDSDRFYDFKTKGYSIVQSRDAFVYHFTCRGSRYRGERLVDSAEWKKSNYKNLRNFIRKWGNTPLYDENKHPMILPKKEISAMVLTKNEGERMFEFLEHIEPYFDEIIVLNDNSTDNTISEVERYMKEQNKLQPTNFKPDKIKIITRPLNGDFAQQCNFGISEAKNRWIFKADADERFNPDLLNTMGILIHELETQNKDVKSVGFARINTIDGIMVNDVPRNVWHTPELQKYKDNQSFNNKDVQFRLFRNDEKLVGFVHEVPQGVYDKDQSKFLVSQKGLIHHLKTSQRQQSQDGFYNELIKENQKDVSKIFYESVIYTYEGITHHAREELKELKKRGYQLFLGDHYKGDKFGEEFKEMYEPFDVTKDDYVTIINQPPSRWGRVAGMKNQVGYLAVEAIIPDDWVKTINESQIQQLWTPSTFSQQMLVNSGVKKPTVVIPHGIDPNVWKPLNEQKGTSKPFKFLAAGTLHNNRKGLDGLIWAFNEAFKDREDVQLILKINPIYNRKMDIERELLKNIKGNPKNIFITTEDLSEKEMVELFNSCDVYVSPHRSEGFGINILQAMSCGIPVISTNYSGNIDFCNKENSLLIKTKGLEHAPLVHPYEKATWATPDFNHLKELLTEVYDNFNKHKETSMNNVSNIHTNWNWSKTVEKMIKHFPKYIKGD